MHNPEDLMRDIEPPKFIQIAVSEDGTLYALDSYGDIYMRVVKMSGEFWRKIPGRKD